MTYGYSNDLRVKALTYYDQSGQTQAQVCKIFGIGVRTFGNWVRLRRRGDYRRRVGARPRPAHKLDRGKLEAYIAVHPDAYLREIGTHFGVTDVAILYACRRWDITRKKNHSV